jgi:hypothetical protein
MTLIVTRSFEGEVEDIRRLKEKQEIEMQEQLLKLGTSCLLFEEDQNTTEIERMYYGDSDEVKCFFKRN